MELLPIFYCNSLVLYSLGVHISDQTWYLKRLLFFICYLFYFLFVICYLKSYISEVSWSTELSFLFLIVWWFIEFILLIAGIKKMVKLFWFYYPQRRLKWWRLVWFCVNESSSQKCIHAHFFFFEFPILKYYSRLTCSMSYSIFLVFEIGRASCRERV